MSDKPNQPSPRDKAHRAKVVRSVRVSGENRPVFYATQPRLFDARGRTCLSPEEACLALLEYVKARQPDSVVFFASMVLMFVFDGAIPGDIRERLIEADPPPLVIST